MKRIAFFSLLLGIATAVGAQQMGGQGMTGGEAGAVPMKGSGHSGMGQVGGQGMMGPSAAALANGEVRKVDKDASKITIKHGPIANLDMPGMTMVFQVKDPVLLDRAKAGEKVRFSADKIGGAYVVTRIEPTK